jgi:hypothetical protein
MESDDVAFILISSSSSVGLVDTRAYGTQLGR